MNKRFTLLILTALLGASPGIAQDASSDWSGVYAGGMVSFDDAGFLRAYVLGVLDDVGDTNDVISFGGFAGYNFQNGNFVVGGEFAISSGGVNLVASPENQYETFYDVKARIGYAFGPALTYVVVGRSFSNLSFGGADISSSGLAYGTGLDYMINDNLFAGVEYLVRDMSGNYSAMPQISAETTIQSVQIRVGWKF